MYKSRISQASPRYSHHPRLHIIRRYYVTWFYPYHPLHTNIHPLHTATGSITLCSVPYVLAQFSRLLRGKCLHTHAAQKDRLPRNSSRLLCSREYITHKHHVNKTTVTVRHYAYYEQHIAHLVPTSSTRSRSRLVSSIFVLGGRVPYPLVTRQTHHGVTRHGWV